jgi:plastocyanin
MRAIGRVLLTPIMVVVLIAGLVMACGGADNNSPSATATRPAETAASPSPAASSTPAATAVPATATTAPAAPAPTNTIAPPPPPPANTPVPPPPPQPTVPPAPPAPPAATTVNITIADFSFTPNALTVRAGQAVTVSLRNSGAASHTFTITGSANSGTIAGGFSGSAQFTAAAPGTLSFFCSIHGAARMSGQITVTN